MYVGARCAAGHGVTERYEWDPLGPKISHQSLALRAIGMDGDVHRVMMIESEVIVDRGLAKGTDGQHTPKLTGKELLYLGSVFKRPLGCPVEAYERGSRKIPSRGHSHQA